MKLVHIRVPGRNSEACLCSIREAYINGTEPMSAHLLTRLEINEPSSYQIGVRYSHPGKLADYTVNKLAEHVNETVRESIKVGIEEVVIVTDAQFVIVVTDPRGIRTSTDAREAKARANATVFDLSMWSIRTGWRLKSWSLPRFVVYDYDGRDGRKVWSWVFHFGPWWFIRERYAL